MIETNKAKRIPMTYKHFLYLSTTLMLAGGFSVSLQAGKLDEAVRKRHYPEAQAATQESAKEDAITALKTLVSRSKTPQTAKTLEAILAKHQDITDTEVPGLAAWLDQSVAASVAGSTAGSVVERTLTSGRQAPDSTTSQRLDIGDQSFDEGGQRTPAKLDSYASGAVTAAGTAAHDDSPSSRRVTPPLADAPEAGGSSTEGHGAADATSAATTAEEQQIDMTIDDLTKKANWKKFPGEPKIDQCRRRMKEEVASKVFLIPHRFAECVSLLTTGTLERLEGLIQDKWSKSGKEPSLRIIREEIEKRRAAASGAAGSDGH